MRSSIKKPKVAKLQANRSWGILIVGVVMLLVGLVVGYVSRPLIDLKYNPAANQASPNLSDLVISNTRHFIGNPDAPVTIIEFSDFQ